MNVRLQHIADESEISVGNLAYHFKTKDDIVETLYEKIRQGQHDLLADLRMIPLFVNLHHYIVHTFSLQQRFSFFFTDTLEVNRSYPAIRKKHQEHLEWQIIQFRIFLEFNLSRGALRSIDAPDSPESLAHRFIMVSDTWLCFRSLQGVKPHETGETDYELNLWGLLSPYFTTAGQAEYRQMQSLPFDGLG